MSAEELRIGNIIKHSLTECVVESIFNCENIDVSNEYEEWNALLDECKPIPLTEEWLIKFGFEKTKGYVFKIDKFSLFDHNYDQVNLFLQLNSPNVPLIHIKFVHQLQNLYFALTGKELKPC